MHDRGLALKNADSKGLGLESRLCHWGRDRCYLRVPRKIIQYQLVNMHMQVDPWIVEYVKEK